MNNDEKELESIIESIERKRRNTFIDIILKAIADIQSEFLRNIHKSYFTLMKKL